MMAESKHESALAAHPKLTLKHGVATVEYMQDAEGAIHSLKFVLPTGVTWAVPPSHADAAELEVRLTDCHEMLQAQQLAAAELRAALAKMADLVFTISSADEELSFPHYEDTERTQAYLAAHRRAKKAAWEKLQELAAEYDGVPVPAATEGSE